MTIDQLASQLGVTVACVRRWLTLGCPRSYAGRKLDLDRLRQAMVHSNRAHEIYLELSSLRQAVPCPCMGLDTLAEYPAVLSLAGRPELVDYLEDRYEKARAKADREERKMAPTKAGIVMIKLFNR